MTTPYARQGSRILAAIGLPQALPLLERDDATGHLHAALAGLAGGGGVVAVVSGEAGVGKTSLVRRFCEELDPGVRVVRGGCDDLTVAQAFGPIWDIAEAVGSPLVEALDSGDRGVVARTLREELARRSPTVCVIEDAHWADEVTLDVLAHLSRRIRGTGCLVLITFRDDELTLEHRLRQVVGSIPAGDVVRIPLDPLSRDAVVTLAPAGFDPDELFALTRGNPFLVTEAISEPGARVPASVRDAVLARLARLPVAARALAELAAVVPSAIELDVVDPVTDPAALRECVELGVIELDGARLRFRHELARHAVEQTLPAPERRRLNASVLSLLQQAGADAARLAHHAAEAGDGAALLQFGLAAAGRAAAAGAHRDAFAGYVLARPELVRLAPAERAGALGRLATEAHLSGEIDVAVEAQEEALQLLRAEGDARAIGAATSTLAVLHSWAGDGGRALELSAEAVELVEPFGGPDKARVLAEHALLLMINSRDDEAIAVGERAASVAAECGETTVGLGIGVTVATARFHRDPAEGGAGLRSAIADARAAGDPMAVGRGFVNLAENLNETRRYAESEATIVQGIAFAEEHELGGFGRHMVALRAQLRVATGRWQAAFEDIEDATGDESVASTTRAAALAALTTLLVRGGDPRADSVAHESWELNSGLGELVGMRMAACAAAELALSGSDFARVENATAPLLTVVERHGNEWDIGGLAFLRWRAGLEHAPLERCADPFRLQMAGNWQAAADAWSQIGAPYEQAQALADSEAEMPLLEALAIADRLGALPLASVLRGKLRRLGVRAIPRGPRPSTRANIAGLSTRQVEVLELVALGLSNPEIARRLFLTPKTVEHHVGSILRKLRVSSRSDAAETARTLGLLPPPS